ncbi:hypothetical protein ENHAE0001_0658 [Enhydrobacter aerosaccus SK60]|nr:hypothetical protein ENHAE0001_0658 [Enhydrobacter aerosaccus SK60]
MRKAGFKPGSPSHRWFRNLDDLLIRQSDRSPSHRWFRKATD